MSWLDNDPNINFSCSHIKYSDEEPNFLARLFQAGAKAKKVRVGNENFFNYKKKRVIAAWGVAFAVIIVVAIAFCLDLSLNSFFAKLSQASSTSYFLITLLMGLFTFLLCDLLVKIVILRDQAKEELKEVTKFEWFSFSITSFFIQSITPFSIGSEPYTIWWLNKKGVSLKRASAIVAVTSFCWFVGQFLITWPSFIYLTIQSGSKITSLQTYWAVLGGLFIDMAVAIVIFSVSYFKKMHYWLSMWVNTVKKYMDLPHSTEEEIAIKYLEKNTFQKIYVDQIKRKVTLKVVAYYLLANLYLYLLFVFILRLFSSYDWSSSKAIATYNIINVSTTANNFIPLPSAEGSLHVVIKNLLSSLENSGYENLYLDNVNNKQAEEAHKSAILLWRFFSKYLGLIISVIFLSLYGINSSSIKLKKFTKVPQIVQTPHELIF
ncbi:hypothetical protein A6V39_02085 [Candidatus Mycoplasma haematobovis]|uniref:Uncharacterized protein n=1 Tax=Candidatus Mycoplasma haematobovis TaxID=432608 RepID=A0A1A9QE38_9MOLU|nr:lysylphosphatidylglycerol synthase domain-containing protein [Candidatus Mycoplasma haematobovis]OAL10215.1 hypothetical protein A6V39_02085 [Candidatus Mycoplasma haematobovis]